MQDKPISRWWTVASGALGVAVGAGLFLVYVFSVMAKTIAADLGFDRSVMSFSATCFLIATGFGTVSLGILISRWGVRLPSIIYLVVSTACVAAIPLLPPVPWVWYVLFAAFGLAGAAATALPYVISIAGLFDQRRGLALGLAVAGGGIGATFGPQLAAHLLSTGTWREAIWVVSAIMGLPIIAMAFLVRTPAAITGSGASAQQSAFRWSKCLADKSFWTIALMILGISVGTFGVLAILVPLLTDRGITPAKAATILSIAGVSSWAARVVIGWVLDHVWAPLVTSLVCVGACVGALAIAFGGSSTLLIGTGAALMGLALGAEADLLAYLCSRYFSLQAFSRIVGAMWVMWAWGGGVGTAMGGIAYKTTGSYETALLYLVGPMALGAVVVLFLGPYLFAPAVEARPRLPQKYAEAH